MSFAFRVKKYKNSKEGSIYTYRKLKSGKVIERKTGFSLLDASSWSKSKQKQKEVQVRSGRKYQKTGKAKNIYRNNSI